MKTMPPPSLFKLRRAQMTADRESAEQQKKPVEPHRPAAPSEGLRNDALHRALPLPSAPLVRIEEDRSTSGGRKMVAARMILAGTELFREDAILLVHTHRRDLETVCREGWTEFLKKPPDAQKRILSFHTPVQDCDERAIRKFATDSAGVISAEETERFVQLGLIMKANSAVAQQPSECEAETATLGLGLYELGCRANHSECLHFAPHAHRFHLVSSYQHAPLLAPLHAPRRLRAKCLLDGCCRGWRCEAV
jgi:hypothetical protein